LRKVGDTTNNQITSNGMNTHARTVNVASVPQHMAGTARRPYSAVFGPPLARINVNAINPDDWRPIRIAPCQLIWVIRNPRQIIECCAWDRWPPRFLIHDRDSRHGAAFERRLRHLGIEEARTNSKLYLAPLPAINSDRPAARVVGTSSTIPTASAMTWRTVLLARCTWRRSRDPAGRRTIRQSRSVSR
jgi:hypothetical protein